MRIQQHKRLKKGDEIKDFIGRYDQGPFRLDIRGKYVYCHTFRKVLKNVILSNEVKRCNLFLFEVFLFQN